MATKKKVGRVNRNKKPQIKAGDKYAVSTNVELVDVDGDGAVDMTLTQVTTRNGDLFFESRMVWYGIDPVIAEAFAETFKSELGTDIPVKNFGQLVKHFKMLVKGTEKITDVGAIMAEGLGEAAD